MNPQVVVALPGMLCNEQLWAQPGFDLGPGFALHPTPLHGSTVDELVSSVLALPHPEMTLIGLSLGGIVALGVALAAPERVNRLAVLSATARPPRPGQHRSWDQMADLVADGGFASITPELLLPVLVKGGCEADRALRDAVVSMADQIGPQQFLEQLSAQHSRIDLRPALSRVTCPVLAVAAAHDALVPGEALREIADGVPNGQLEVLAEAGHLCTLEQPVEVSRRLRSWLLSGPGLTMQLCARMIQGCC